MPSRTPQMPRSPARGRPAASPLAHGRRLAPKYVGGPTTGRGRRRRRLPGRRSYRPRLPWQAAALATTVCTAAVALATVMIVHARASECRTPPATLIDAAQVTAEEGFDPTPPAGLTSRAEYLASCSGGTLLLLRAAGRGAQSIAPVRLRAYREPGQLENDPIARASAIRRLIAKAVRRDFAAPIRGDGRDLIGLLTAISQDRNGATTDVWLTTFGLPTVAPADSRILMAADPAQAAESIRHFLPDLRGVRVHLILNPAAGVQPPLNTVTDAWRRAFLIDLLRDAGASVVSVTEVHENEQSAPGAPPAPPVRNLPEATPRPAGKPAPGKVFRVNLDSAAFFLPNSTAFATGRRQVLASLVPVISAWKTGGYSHVAVVGHCARFGPERGAVALSRRRAGVIADLLRAAGISSVTATGVGYSEPLPPNPYSASNRVVIVTIYPKAQRSRR
jgi:outer membrane protein OmpA-like peptidoglycan-associated protein